MRIVRLTFTGNVLMISHEDVATLNNFEECSFSLVETYEIVEINISIKSKNTKHQAIHPIDRPIKQSITQ